MARNRNMAEASVGGWARWRLWLIAAGAALISVLLIDAFRALLGEVHYAEVMQQMAAEPLQDLVLAALATAASYLVLTGYDLSAMKYAQVQIRRSTVMMTSFIAYALGNTVGLGVLTGGAVRMRLYSAAGIEANKVAQVIAFNASAFTFGTAAFGAAGLIWGADGVYTHQLWWQFEFDAHAPRSLRAMVGVALAGAGVASWHLLRPSPGQPVLPSNEEVVRARRRSRRPAPWIFYSRS